MNDQTQPATTPKRRPLLSAEDVNKWHKAAMRAIGDNEVRRKWGDTKAGSPVVTMFLCEDVSRLQIERAEMLASLKFCSDRLEMSRKELLILNDELDRKDDPQNESADNADQEAIAQTRAIITKAEAAITSTV